MAKKQTRRSVSLSRVMYERLRNHCEINGLSMSAFVESRIDDFIGKAPVAVVQAAKVVAAPAPASKGVVATPAAKVFAPPAAAKVFAPPAIAAAPVAAVAKGPTMVTPPPMPVPAPVPASRIPSAAMLGSRPAIKNNTPPVRDEQAARRAAERIFTF